MTLDTPTYRLRARIDRTVAVPSCSLPVPGLHQHSEARLGEVSGPEELPERPIQEPRSIDTVALSYPHPIFSSLPYGYNQLPAAVNRRNAANITTFVFLSPNPLLVPRNRRQRLAMQTCDETATSRKAHNSGNSM